MKTFHAIVMMDADAQQMFVVPAFAEDLDALEMAESVAMQEETQGNKRPAGYAVVTDQSNFFLVDKETGKAQLIDDALLETLQDKDGCDLAVQVYSNTIPVDEVIEHIHKLYTQEQVGSASIH